MKTYFQLLRMQTKLAQIQMVIFKQKLVLIIGILDFWYIITQIIIKFGTEKLLDIYFKTETSPHTKQMYPILLFWTIYFSLLIIKVYDSISFRDDKKM